MGSVGFIFKVQHDGGPHAKVAAMLRRELREALRGEHLSFYVNAECEYDVEVKATDCGTTLSVWFPDAAGTLNMSSELGPHLCATHFRRAFPELGIKLRHLGAQATPPPMHLAQFIEAQSTLFLVGSDRLLGDHGRVLEKADDLTDRCECGVGCRATYLPTRRICKIWTLELAEIDDPIAKLEAALSLGAYVMRDDTAESYDYRTEREKIVRKAVRASVVDAMNAMASAHDTDPQCAQTWFASVQVTANRKNLLAWFQRWVELAAEGSELAWRVPLSEGRLAFTTLKKPNAVEQLLAALDRAPADVNLGPYAQLFTIRLAPKLKKSFVDGLRAKAGEVARIAEAVKHCESIGYPAWVAGD